MMMSGGRAGAQQASASVHALLSQLSASYPVQNRQRIETDVVTLCSSYPSLVPRIGTLMHNTGTESRLLSLNGTFPITYQANTYHLPCEILLAEPYPSVPPVVFLRPVPGMSLKRGHTHVDGEGKVYLPYLSEWNQTTHNLVVLVTNMSSVFGNDPPVYSTGAANSGTSTAAVATTAHHAHTMGSPAVAAQPTTVVHTPNPMAAAAAVRGGAYRTTTSTGATPFGAATAAVSTNRTTSGRDERAALEEEVTTKLQEALGSYYNKVRTEIDDEFRTQRKLEQGQKTAKDILTELQAFKQRLTECMETVRERRGALSDWHEEQAKRAETTRPADLIQPMDVASRQMGELVSEYHAIEDTIYYLDKSLNDGSLPLDDFVRSVKRLARQQFMVKAHLLKIVATQQQSAFRARA